MKRFEALNVRTNQMIAAQVVVAESYLQKLKGLLGRRDMDRDEGFFLPDCSSIHTMFMKFPIDVIFLDKENRITKIVESVGPFRMSAGTFKTVNTLELSGGKLKGKDFSVGDKITLLESAEFKQFPAMRFSLTMMTGASVNETFIFSKAEVSIGHSFFKNDFIINDHHISDKHVRITQAGKRFYIENLQDENLTSLNGVELKGSKKFILHDGDKIILGETVIKFSHPVKQYPLSLQSDVNGKGMEESSQEHKKINTSESMATSKAAVIRIFQSKLVRIPAVILFAILLLKVGKNIFFSSDSIFGKKTSNLSSIPIALPAKGYYGNIKSQDTTHPDKVIFTFRAESKNINLNYTVGGIDSVGEVVILLNGSKISDAPLTQDKWGDEKEIRLPGELLIANDENQLVFDNTKYNPDSIERWGVKNVYLDFLPVETCNAEKARRAYDLGEKLYKEKSILLGNLYSADKYYNEAVLNLEGCTPEPELLVESREKSLLTKNELEIAYDDLIFDFKKSIQVKNYEKSKAVLEDILRLIPDEEDHRHIKAVKFLSKIEKVLPNKRR